MEDEYGMADLRHLISNSSRPIFPTAPPDLLSSHRGLNPYDVGLMFHSDSLNNNTTTTTTNAAAGGLLSSGGGAGSSFSGFEGGEGGTGRWPRQETLTLLEIRSRLDPKFKEANQKGPLWDEVSRLMSEEHGYQRSGKKCREKFENLYKYYKKTKEGKAGRQDGKHYRFFRQLEALYGANTDTHTPPSLCAPTFPYNTNTNYPSIPTNNNQDPLALMANNNNDTRSLSLSNNYSDTYDTTSSDDTNPKNKTTSWKHKIRDFIDIQMRKLMEKQEAWMEQMMRTMEHKEQERMLREEEWRKQDAERIEREQRFWASERAWIEARDAALMEALHKLTGKEIIMNNNSDDSIWGESEISRLVQLRMSMEGKFEDEEVMWEEIGRRMRCFGYERSGVVCRDKWDSVNNYLLVKKRNKEEMIYCDDGTATEHQGNINHHTIRLMNDHRRHGNSSPNNNNSNGNGNGNHHASLNDGCFRYFMGDAAAYGRIME